MCVCLGVWYVCVWVYVCEFVCVCWYMCVGMCVRVGVCVCVCGGFFFKYSLLHVPLREQYYMPFSVNYKYIYIQVIEILSNFFNFSNDISLMNL
jgi:hypothetical protein